MICTPSCPFILGILITPRTRLRVVCGLGLTIASFSPARAFSSVDLPALGRPRMQTYPERKGIDFRLDSSVEDGLGKLGRVRPGDCWPAALPAVGRLLRSPRLFAECDLPTHSPIPRQLPHPGARGARRATLPTDPRPCCQERDKTFRFREQPVQPRARR